MMMLIPPDPRISGLIIFGIVLMAAIPPLGFALLVWASIARRAQVRRVRHLGLLLDARAKLAREREVSLAVMSLKL